MSDKTMTQEEMDAIKKRADEITPGPWRVYYAHVPLVMAQFSFLF